MQMNIFTLWHRPADRRPTCIAADALLDRLSTAEILHGDKGYDSDAVRHKIVSKAPHPTSRIRQTTAGRIASRPTSTAIATPSSA